MTLKTKTSALILAIMVLGALVFHSQPSRQEIREAEAPASTNHRTRFISSSPIPERTQGEATPDPAQPEWRSKWVDRLASKLQERLLDEGFSQHEIDITATEVAAEFNKHEDTIKYSE